MTEAERNALKRFVAQHVLFLCEDKLGLKVDAETLRQVAQILVSKHEALSSRLPHNLS